MITASVAVLLLLVIDKKFGSVEIIALPIVVGVGELVWHVDLPICDTDHGCHWESD